MTTQVVFHIEKKLKHQAMKKARTEGLPLASILKLATKAFVAGTLTVDLVGIDELNVATHREIAGALKDINRGKNLSPRFSSAKKAAKYLKG